MAATDTAASVTAERPERRAELDVMRALLVVGLVFFHSALVFDTRDDYYVKNAETTEAVTIVAGLGVVWAMPMLFLIAGLGAWHSLRRRGPGGFAVERLLRLGVPLVFATLVLMPLPQWLRQRSDPGYQESYLSFWPRFFDVHVEVAEFPFLLQGEHFETGHLWFVVLLLVFSLVLAPLVRWVPRGRSGRWTGVPGRLVRRRGMILLPAVPVAVVSGLLGQEEQFGGWHRWAYLLFFLYGFALAADRRLREAMRRDAVPAAVLGPLLLLAALPGFTSDGDPFTDMTALAIVSRILFGLSSWCWLVAILGLVDRRRAPSAPPAPEAARRPTGLHRRVYAYLSEAVLPFYVLHQPIVVAVAYGVVGWDAPILVEYAVIVAVSLVLTVAAYDLLVRRTRLTRFLFGMRTGRTTPA